MKATINAPYSVLHGRPADIINIEPRNRLVYLKIDGYNNALPYHETEVIFEPIKLSEKPEPLFV